MDIKKYTRLKLEKSAEEAKYFWAGVKKRLSPELTETGDTFQVIDIQEISDDCVDIVMLRNNKEANIEQLEHCRIIAEKRFFKKPKIKMYFTSGPFSDEFFKDK